ncbi:MAG: hypothetical protein K2K91_06385, partial [Ruminococcus sp.]|nr:hypothetical protein [Ruminococcus sp.]
VLLFPFPSPFFIIAYFRIFYNCNTKINKDEQTINISLENGLEKWIQLVSIQNTYDGYNLIYIPKDDIIIEGLSGEMGVKTKLGVFLDARNGLSKYVCEMVKQFDYENNNMENYALRTFISLVVNRLNMTILHDKGIDHFEKIFHNRVEGEIFNRVSDEIKNILWKKIARNEMLDNLYNYKCVIYDLNDWSRR